MIQESRLGAYLDFRNGRSSPSRGDAGRYLVFGSNGVIGRANECNADAQTIIIGRVGTYCGSIHFSSEPCWVTDNAIVASAKKPEEARFWYLFLRAYDLNSHRAGSGQPLLNQSILNSIKTSVPDVSTRLAIADILCALDDKIELNRRMNETLEAMARAIFKDWFVDFGPTRAKVAGRPPYLAPDLWSMFPGRLDEESQPAGWRAGEVQDIIDVNPREQLTVGSAAPYLDMAALPTSGPLPEPAVLREFTSGMRFRNGDTLVARITPCLENGKTAFVQSLPADTVGWGSTEFVVLRSKAPIPPAYTYLLARDPAFRACAIQSMTGTSGRQRARHEVLASYCVTIPTEGVWVAFGSLIGPIFERIKANGLESDTLAQTRDLLLPKLMSGEIRVRDAERAVEAAA